MTRLRICIGMTAAAIVLSALHFVFLKSIFSVAPASAFVVMAIILWVLYIRGR